MFKRVLFLAAAGLAALGVGVSTAAAQGRHDYAFLCYSKWEIDPGVWSMDGYGSEHSWTAAYLMSLGMWSPYAETSVPTQTQLPNGYYLICNLGEPALTPSATAPLAPVAGTIVTQKGVVYPTNPEFASTPGYYPLAAATSSGATE